MPGVTAVFKFLPLKTIRTKNRTSGRPDLFQSLNKFIRFFCKVGRFSGEEWIYKDFQPTLDQREEDIEKIELPPLEFLDDHDPMRYIIQHDQVF
jgi:hypothetical protein